MTGRVRAAATVRPFARACAAEWSRLWTVRTTWWCLLATAVTMIGLGTLLGLDAAGAPSRAEPWPPATQVGELALLPGQFPLLVLVLLAVTSEYTSGVIGGTLQWTPRRDVLLAARLVVPVAVATVAGVVLALLADVAAWLAFPTLELSLDLALTSLGTVAAVLVGGGALAAGAGFLLRSTGGGLAAVVLLMLVLPVFLPNFGVGWMDTLAAHLPGGAVVFLVAEETFDLTSSTARLVLAGWAAAAVAAGGLSLLRRDAT